MAIYKDQEEVPDMYRDALILLEILRRIPRRGNISSKDIGDSLKDAGIDLRIRSLQRYLKTLVEHEDFGVVCDKSAKPYRYTRNDSNSDLLQWHLTPNECLLLGLAQESLKNQLPPKVLTSLKHLFDEASKAMNDSNQIAKQKSWLKKVRTVSGTLFQIPPYVDPKIFDAVADALFGDTKLRLTYVTLDKKRLREMVSPLGLIMQEARIYLVCKLDSNNELRHLALHRIKEAEVTKFVSERHATFDLDKYINSRHVNYGNGKKIRLILEFTNKQTASVLEETPFEKHQKITELPNGAFRLEAVVEDSILVDGWLGAWTAKAGIYHVERIPIE